ncbi:AAC(3) family N-acetyltransferase [Desulfovibrio sp. JC010]|uniref:AAC(3) family N-acetyltransferase n=1 Tax=Desulfovibrio sp. JC010 TaxID=2593641 RepID=UPI0013D1CCB2|nr:AAC(3) family N-acetyltransferase [Desulfovibrio sp. JC010]NDV27177.1 AAC(3) family N-acetyltransferase [Desulfovibrio sp. JC010]
MISRVYSKYRDYRLGREKIRLKDKADQFSHLFMPTAPFSFKDFAGHLEQMGVSGSDNILLRMSNQVSPYLSDGLMGFYGGLFDYADGGGGHIMSLSYSFDRSPLMYLSLDNVFDPENTPTTIGLCNEIFRRMDSVSRSLHPTHSVSVYGRHSKDITSRHHMNPHTYSEESPFAHLYKHSSGKEVIVGLNHASTGQHFIEDQFTITGKIDKPILNRLKVGDEVRQFPFYADNPFVKFDCYFRTDAFRSLLMERGILKQSVLNGVTIYVHDCKKFYEELPAIYTSEDAPFKRMYLKTFMLNTLIRPLVLKSFFVESSGQLLPRGTVSD